MIRIGFEEDELDVQFDEDGNPKVNHGDGFDSEKKDKLKSKTVYIPERRIAQIKQDYDCVVVMDFGDEYHLSEEERIAKNKFYQAFKSFSKFKHKYRKLDEYVVAMREALKCLDYVANNNGVYEPEKFKKLFYRDKIYVNGLVFPKFSGPQKKNISWDYVSEFILSDRDPSEIIPKKDDEIFTKDELEEMEDSLFDKGELDRIVAPMTDEEIYESNLYFDVDEDDQKDKNVVVFLDKKESKKLIKAQPEFLYQIKEMRKSQRSLENMSRLAYDLTSADIEEIASYDKSRSIASNSDIPEFKGDMTKGSDYRRYLLALEEYERTQIKNDYNGKMKTKEEIDELELKQVLENNGWNIRNLYGNKEKEEKLKRIRKKEKQREKELREKLIKVQARRKRRMGEEVDEEASSSKKKKKKNKNKGNDIKKAIKDRKKKINKHKKETEENIDEFLLSSSKNISADSFKDYQNESLDWSWDSIMDNED